MSDIKTCPHCGGTATLFHWVDFDVHDTRYFIMVRCGVCGATGAQKETTKDDWEQSEQTAAAADCITAWNLRCLSDDIETLIDERIAAALDEQAQIAPESAILAAGLIAELEDEDETAAE